MATFELTGENLETYVFDTAVAIDDGVNYNKICDVCIETAPLINGTAISKTRAAALVGGSAARRCTLLSAVRAPIASWQTLVIDMVAVTGSGSHLSMAA